MIKCDFIFETKYTERSVSAHTHVILKQALAAAAASGQRLLRSSTVSNGSACPYSVCSALWGGSWVQAHDHTATPISNTEKDVIEIKASDRRFLGNILTHF